MKELVKEKIDKINGVLAALPALPYHGLLSGNLGLLYYYYHIGQALQNEALLEQAEDMLGQVFADMNESDGGLVGAGYSGGGAGFGFVANYLNQQGFVDFDADEELGEMDEYMAEVAIQQLEDDNPDPMHGALGILHYFTTRNQTPLVNKLVNTIVDKVLSKAIFTEAGVWYKNTVWKEPDSPIDINLSLSHGLSGILLILLQAYPLVTHPQPLERVIREGIRFIQSHETEFDLEKKYYSFFPGSYKEMDGKPAHPAERLAWCYGDLNQVLLGYRAGRVLNDTSYTAFADRIGLASLVRNTLALSFNEDAHFCHGTAGLAQMYQALYKEAPHPGYQIAYEFWVKQTVDLVDTCIAENKFERTPAGLLEGWAGVGIVLAEYLSDEPKPWSKVFFL